MKDRTHQAGIITIAEFTRFGVKSVIGIVLARLISPAELGSYRQLFLIYTTFSTLMMMGIPQSLLYFLPKLASDEEKRLHVGKIMNLSLVLSLLFTLVLLAFRGLIADKFSNPQLDYLLVIYAIYPVFMFSSSCTAMLCSDKAMLPRLPDSRCLAWLRTQSWSWERHCSAAICHLSSQA
mgnify:CR=1 FL=1